MMCASWHTTWYLKNNHKICMSLFISLEQFLMRQPDCLFRVRPIENVLLIQTIMFKPKPMPAPKSRTLVELIRPQMQLQWDK